MSQLNKIIEEDPMSNSYENNKMVVVAGYAEIARSLIADGVETPKDAVNRIKERFAGDKIFFDIFPTIFNIEICKHKMKR